MVVLPPCKEREACHWQFYFGKGTSMRDEEESLPVGNKELPNCVLFRLVCSWLFKSTTNLSSGASLDCLEALPMPAKHAAPFARLLC